jgi:uncharacterized protein (DUF433 family)
MFGLMPPAIDPAFEPTRGDLGMGVYALADLRRFLAFSGSPEDAKWAARWLRTALNTVDHDRWRADYSFSDLVSLFVVRQLRHKGVKPQTIQRAEQHLRTLWKTDRPFAREEIKTDGFEVLCEDNPSLGQIEGAGLEGQQIMRMAIENSLESVHYLDQSAAYWTPTPGIVVDPRVQFGSPVVEGTRVPTDAVSGVAQELGKERAARRFDLPVALVESAISFEATISSFA